MFGFLDGYTQSILIFTGINIVAAYSFFAPYKTGQVSLGQAGFMAVGAYASAIATQKFGLPFAVALVFGGVVARGAGRVVGFPARGVKGIYPLLRPPGVFRVLQVGWVDGDYPRA